MTPASGAVRAQETAATETAGREQYLVYGLVDPQTGQLRYIGKTEWPELRKFDHLVSRAHTVTERTRLGAWMRRLRKANLQPKFVEMEWCPDKPSMNGAEAFWVMYHRDEMGTDLLNVLDGSVRAVMVAELNGYLLHDGRRWRVESVLKKASVSKIGAEELVPVLGLDCQPSEPEFFERDGGRYLNAYVPPQIIPKRGEHPVIDRLLTFLCDGDEGAVRYVTHWIARKVQEPDRRNMTAIVLRGQQGTGKNFLANVLIEMIGPSNCARIGQSALESHFNGSYTDKLLVVADEVVNRKSLFDTSSTLKQLITDDPLMIEQKYAPARMVPNRLSWIFTSNDSVPVRVEGKDDRRYSVFSNRSSATAEHKAMLLSCGKKNSFTDEFLKGEIAAFMHDLLELEVDDALLRDPYDNDARRDLITAGQNSVEAFCEELSDLGLERMAKVRNSAPIVSDIVLTREGTVRTDRLYSLYVDFCKHEGRESFNSSKFGAELKRVIPRCNKRKLQGPRRDETDPRRDRNERISVYAGLPVSLPEDVPAEPARVLTRPEIIEWGRKWMEEHPGKEARVSAAVELEFGKKIALNLFKDRVEVKKAPKRATDLQRAKGNHKRASARIDELSAKLEAAKRDQAKASDRLSVLTASGERSTSPDQQASADLERSQIDDALDELLEG